MKNSIKHLKGQFHLLLFPALLLFSIALPAQTEQAAGNAKKIYAGFGHLIFSGEQLNLQDLNQSFTAGNYGTINPYSSSFGGGGAYVFNNFVVGGGGAWLMSSKTQNQVNSVNLKGGYGYFSFGYVLHSGRRSLLYPTLGLGGGGYNIFISKKDQQADFSQQLNAPAGMITLDAGGWMTNVQITYLYFLTKKSMEGFCIGLKAGYKYSPYNWNTTMNNTSLANSPKINMNGVFLSVILGGGGALGN